jgi:hypothetical protein
MPGQATAPARERVKEPAVRHRADVLLLILNALAIIALAAATFHAVAGVFEGIQRWLGAE